MSNLQEEIALWQTVFRVGDWVIHAVEKPEVIHEIYGSVYGQCFTNTHNREAWIEIAAPKNDRERAEWPETVCHEMLHVMLAECGIYVADIEEQVVWTLARVLAWFRVHAADALQSFVDSLPWKSPTSLARKARRDATQPRALLVARARARAGEKRMDPTLAKVLLALVEQSSMSDEEKAPLKMALEAIIGGENSADPEETVEEAMSAEKPDDAKPPMGMAQDGETEDVKLKRARATKDVAREERRAAVDMVLQSRPDLSDSAKAYARARGEIEGLPAMKAYLDTLPARPATGEPAGSVKTRMGLPEAPRSGKSPRPGFRPSANPRMREAFRLMLDEEEEDSSGVELRAPGVQKGDPEKGVLMSMSILKAYPRIKKSVDEQVAAARARMTNNKQVS